VRTVLFPAVGVAAALILGSCGGAREGDACTREGYRCDGASAVLECRGNRWVALPCSGPGGCSSVIGGTTCDVTGNQVGDGCPAAMEGSGFCRGNPPSLFACRSLLLVKLQDCSSCVVGTGSITCSP